MKTLLKVISILYIIGAAICLIIGIVLIAGGASSAVGGGGSDLSYGIAALGIGGGIICIIAIIPTLLIGIFGLKGCGGKKGLLTAGLVLTIIELVFTVIGLFTAISQGTFSAGTIGGLILPVLYVISGLSVRKEL